MGLIGGMARTAVVAGTATAVSNRVSRRQANRWASQDQSQYAPPQYAQPQYVEPQYVQAAPAGAPAPDPIEQLKQLAELKNQGILTEEEFAVQKAKILGS
jgi:Short C-terminal domain